MAADNSKIRIGLRDIRKNSAVCYVHERFVEIVCLSLMIVTYCLHSVENLFFFAYQKSQYCKFLAWHDTLTQYQRHTKVYEVLPNISYEIMNSANCLL